MPQTPKEKPKPDQATGDPDVWEKDQEKREYYYDDAHGYERYDPQEQEGDDEPDGEEA